MASMASRTSTTLTHLLTRRLPHLRTNPFRTSKPFRRHAQTVAGTPTVSGAPSASSSSSIPAPQSLLTRLWTSEVGVKTVHFWAPVMKWCLVIAGVGDFFRPAEKLSLTQNGALTATGAIWTRWCLIIRPKNYLLAAVNFCLAIVGTVQVSRILAWRSSQKGGVAAEGEDVVEKGKEVLSKGKEEVKGALKS